MAPTKRTAVAPVRAAKVAKREEQTAKADVAKEVVANPAPIVAIFETLLNSTSEPCVAMLRAALPHVLSTKAEDRHNYQHSVVAMLDKLVQETEAKMTCNVNAAEAHAASVAEEKAAAAEKLQEAKCVEATLLEEKQNAENMNAEAEVCKKRAAEEVANERKRLEEAQAVVQSKTDAREGYQHGLADTWEPLKANSFAGKDWRVKHKAIERLSTLLDQAIPPRALAVSLPVALRAKPEARGPFALQAIAATEAELQSYVQQMMAQEVEFKEASAAQAEVLQKAEEAAVVQEEKYIATQQLSFDAQNAWVDANSVALALDTTDMEQKEVLALTNLEAARGALNTFCGHVAAYELLVRASVEAAEAPIPDEPVIDGKLAGEHTQTLATDTKDTLEAVEKDATDVSTSFGTAGVAGA